MWQKNVRRTERKSKVIRNEELVTIPEVAVILRCSKAHVYKAVSGKLTGVSPLPAIHMGRRRLVRRSALGDWMSRNEHVLSNILPASPEVDAAGRMKGNAHP